MKSIKELTEMLGSPEVSLMQKQMAASLLVFAAPNRLPKEMGPPLAVPPKARMTSALAVNDPWTRERLDVIKNSICPQGVTDAEFELFIEACKRSGLDPTQKQIFCVPRSKNVGSKDRPKWVSVNEPQPSEAGMLARAEDFPDYRGCTASAVHEKDSPRVISSAKGTVDHEFIPGGDRGRLLGAWGMVTREGRTPVVVWLEIAGYTQATPLWQKIPGTMIEKCARAAALRKSFPKAFGGLYIAEEMPVEGQVVAHPRQLPAAAVNFRPSQPKLVASTVEPVAPPSDPDPPPVEAEWAPPVDASPEPPSVAEPSEEEKILALVFEAQGQPDLDRLIPKIQRLTKAEQDRVRPVWMARKKELANATA